MRRYGSRPRYSPFAKRRRTIVPRGMPSGRDQTSVTVTAYFEVKLTQPLAAAAGGHMAYVLKLDPAHAAIVLSTTNTNNAVLSANQGGVAALELGTANNRALPFPRFAKYRDLFTQYRIDGAKVEISTDRECGLENPVITLTDKADSTPVVDIQTAVQQSHKSTLPTESKRMVYYSWSPKTTADRDFHKFDSAGIDGNSAHYLKILQDVPAINGGKCTHRVTVTMRVTVKDQSDGHAWPAVAPQQ